MKVLFLRHMPIILKTRLLATLILFLPLSGNVTLAQFFDDFSDGNLDMNPTWQGDLSDFNITEDGVLVLDADEAGFATLFASYMADSQQEWQMNFDLSFNPSDNNRLIIYLALDTPDLDIASGYTIEIGENLSNDAIVVKRLDNGVQTEIARATDGAVATSPDVRLRMRRDDQSFWSLAVDYAGNSFLLPELEFFDDEINFNTAYFGIQCQFTSSNRSGFRFDDIYVGDIRVDDEPPRCTDLTVVQDDLLQLSFDELLDDAVLAQSDLFSIAPDVGVASTSFGSFNNVLLLQLDSPIESGTLYTLSISPGIADQSGNLTEQLISKTFFSSEAAGVGDLIINEILFDPFSGGQDFVEIKNVSDKFLSLNQLTISNMDREEQRSISSDLVLLPDHVIAISSDTSFLRDRYLPEGLSNALLGQGSLPAFNLDEGNVTISTADGVVIDGFDYSDDLHFSLLRETKGVSLERISDDIATDDLSNWTSAAASVGFATPGYENSANVDLSNPDDESFSLQTKTFSPNGDSMDDQMIISYTLPQSGYVGTVEVYDGVGRFITALLANEQLATQGIIRWDGLNDDGVLSEIGPYVVLIDAFHPDGTIFKTKLTCILADFLN